MDELINFLASEKWARVLGSLVAITTLLTIIFKVFKKKKTNPPEPSSGYQLTSIWNRLHPNMQDAFVLANNERKRLGHDKLHTELLFRALVRLGDSNLVKLFQQLPEGALPEPSDATDVSDDTLFADKPILSGCVQDSIESYMKLPKTRAGLTPVDVFVDIGKHGHGKSVSRLRDHGVDADSLEQIAHSLGYELIRREAIV